MTISTFRGQYAFLSNFHPSPILVYDRIWPTVEHAYQAAKTLDSNQQEYIRFLTPGEAKRAGRKIKLRDDWEEVKEKVMSMLVREKFNQIPELTKALIATSPQILIEGNMWHDNYWGICYCKRCGGHGKNRLGAILMEVRETIIINW